MALIIITGSAIFAKLVSFILEKIVTKWVKKTNTTLDDEILKIIKLPVFLTILFIGTYIALMQLNILLEHHQEIQKIFTAAFILIATISVTRIINGVIRWYTVEFALKTETKFDEQFLPVVRKIIIGFVYAIAIMLILREVFDVEITPLLASLGIVGLAVALALQDTLSNFFAGVYLIADRPIRIGDYIELENGMKGYIEDIGWRSVRIKTLPNNYIIIPNSKLAQSIITNYYAPEQEMSIVVPCCVSYGSDLEKVEKITIEVAKEIQQNVLGAVKNFEPFIRYNNFGDSNIDFSMILRVEKFVDQYLVLHEFIKKLMTRYDKEGIEISFPARNIYFKNEKQ
ncbi:MAG: hypothetical protein BWK75_04370 [Candidatus Altiarchaeales archaeon A3]|nr:MAG: hypothetical protein BWK75_04370 [Candidatus Altiarchaeales archaeon A3]